MNDVVTGESVNLIILFPLLLEERVLRTEFTMSRTSATVKKEGVIHMKLDPSMIRPPYCSSLSLENTRRVLDMI